MDVEDFIERNRLVVNPPSKGFSLTIAIPSDRANFIAELYYKNEQFGELHQETGEITLRLFGKPSEGRWEFSYDEFIAFLQEAKTELVGDSSQEGANKG